MYKTVAAFVAFAALAALAVAGIAQSSISAQSAGGEDRLFGGGRFVYDFDPGPGELILPRDISISATGLDGRKGSGTRWYANPDRPTPALPTSISCLGVERSTAVVGGFDQVGNPIVQYFRDNGPPGPDPPDGITPVWVMGPEDVVQFMPKRFPLVCPSTTPPAEWDAVWSALDSGDIAVVDGQPR